MLSCHKWRCRVEIRWCMTRWTLWQASPAGGGEPPRWESIRIIVPRRAAALWALQMLSAQLPDLLYVRYAPYMLLLYTPYMLLGTRVRCRRNNSLPHARRYCLSRVVMLLYWTILSTPLATPVFTQGKQQRSARILDPGNPRRESPSFFLARPREMIFINLDLISKHESNNM